ncbi:protein of unknown function [Cupriavidus taiwanensis]|uniref:Uncharacterized protein n=1 Tax=Cupriavidus taiwanensis TaxID=164546 RepID=A0A7Z7NK45_9BURK|nr:protein of unknown function [Cupriavidus taiwanensis]SOZ01357.1 hypothetical protein CBM2595_A30228 [Cupriavidus taiwanensis]SPC08908.1 hypothetical protein CBM2594_A40231 [Cupriavidus taiwanensis]SPD38699.1 protein of unknown function [Cupriavidus taiwanensis]
MLAPASLVAARNGWPGPAFFFRGHDGKAFDYTRGRCDRTSKDCGFRQDRGGGSGPGAPSAHWQPEPVLPREQRRKKTQAFELGFESTKGGGWRRHLEIDGGLRAVRRAWPEASLSHSGALSAPSFNDWNYT